MSVYTQYRVHFYMHSDLLSFFFFLLPKDYLWSKESVDCVFSFAVDRMSHSVHIFVSLRIIFIYIFVFELCHLRLCFFSSVPFPLAKFRLQYFHRDKSRSKTHYLSKTIANA